MSFGPGLTTGEQGLREAQAPRLWALLPSAEPTLPWKSQTSQVKARGLGVRRGRAGWPTCKLSSQGAPSPGRFGSQELLWLILAHRT